jgi:hypothetical protein
MPTTKLGKWATTAAASRMSRLLEHFYSELPF